jgi:ribonuclease HI
MEDPQQQHRRFTVWVDGSGHASGGPGGVGYVSVDRDTGETAEGSLPLPSATNQQAEILAAAYALTQLPAGSGVEVVSDSEYVVKGWNEYLPEWQRRGWRKKTGGTPANTRHWQRLIAAAEPHRVTFRWTRGHAGQEQNERADVLAGMARAQAKQQAVTPEPIDEDEDAYFWGDDDPDGDIDLDAAWERVVDRST